MESAHYMKKKTEDVVISNDEGNEVPIEFIPPTEATKAVGVWQDLAGTSIK